MKARMTLLVLAVLLGATAQAEEAPGTSGSLERDGLVSRTVFPTNPPQVEYALTDLGRSMLEPLHAMVQWAVDNHVAIRAARAAYVPPPSAKAL